MRREKIQTSEEVSRVQAVELTTGTGQTSGEAPAGTRRDFLRLGTAALAAVGVSGCGNRGESPANSGTSIPTAAGDKSSSSTGEASPLDLERWQKIRGLPYEEGGVHMPGVCKLPGPNAKRNWPDRNKYKDVEKVPGMCQLCSTVCGIIGYVKDGRIIKVEGNPNDPNSRGHLCARGQAALNHQYHPERLIYPLKRVGERG